tara:strand:+ start:566 stop:712 length:147 start_codon:yes stop_codon:yes gene_type:complete
MKYNIDMVKRKKAAKRMIDFREIEPEIQEIKESLDRMDKIMKRMQSVL